MNFNPDIHHRRSIRLKGYDYSQAGLYFITICVQNREWLLGEIHDGEMVLNDAGKMTENWYYELENKYNDIKCHAMVVMPNHVHFIIENVGTNVRANLCVRPSNDDNLGEKILGEKILGEKILGEKILGEHIGSPLRDIIRWFKTMTTNNYIRGVKQCNWMPFDGKLWQRNYYEHIIRNEREYLNITDYIEKNPMKWDADTLKQNLL